MKDRKLKIRIEKYSSPDKLGYNIFIEGRKGSGFVIAEPLLAEHKPDREIFYKLGVGKKDLVVYISHFYPNGFPGEEENMRKGVGSIVLDFVLKDLKEREIRGINLAATTDYMIKFCNKNNFIENNSFRGLYRRFYKLI
ncbi:MAG: hypothetical protein PHQ66_02680 [Candidatus Nanoarchaeia archaeon]|nr:hypothetical protein [Candidatus Nanoarchaeia archaeon]MDD5357727.1 hypothetical protein [Candidatus Nanoarchaeia archaeon]MDD5588646.1 hypothetical protein [Candidatus Nanoarchaeia archaeon]